MHWFGGGWGAMGAIWMVLMAAFWVAVIVGIVYLIKSVVSGGRHANVESTPPAQGGSEALRILEERYARGDIEREEFLRRKADLLS